jgi:hypothetical protein
MLYLIISIQWKIQLHAKENRIPTSKYWVISQTPLSLEVHKPEQIWQLVLLLQTKIFSFSSQFFLFINLLLEIKISIFLNWQKLACS